MAPFRWPAKLYWQLTGLSVAGFTLSVVAESGWQYGVIPLLSPWLGAWLSKVTAERIDRRAAQIREVEPK